jgi:uncharacterized Zn finger protein
MSRYRGWAPYVPVAVRRQKAQREIARQRKAGLLVSPVVITGRTIAHSFWGKAWCNTMESFSDYQNRLPRGRTYVRNGSVLNLQIAPTRVVAQVSGSSLYTVTMTIAALSQSRWNALRKDCTGGIDSLVDLLQGRLSKAVMERMCDQNTGLFPRPSEIKFFCSCPDSATMCKHVAATLYGIGARLDQEPELLFRLRDIDHRDLVTAISQSLPTAEAPSGKILEADDMAAIFGLDLIAEYPTTKKQGKGAKPATPAPPAKPKGKAPATAKPGRKGTRRQSKTGTRKLQAKSG